jgi:hypothetical protein
MRNTRFSRRSRTNSSRSAFFSPGFSPASTASMASQFRRRDAEIFMLRWGAAMSSDDAKSGLVACKSAVAAPPRWQATA